MNTETTITEHRKMIVAECRNCQYGNQNSKGEMIDGGTLMTCNLYNKYTTANDVCISHSQAGDPILGGIAIVTVRQD
jgi:hypothetical protein